MDAFGLINRLFPPPAPHHRTERGMETERLQPIWWKAATVLGRRAAAHLNQ
jgi:hypothetical protein